PVDALGGGRSGDHWVCSIGQPDGQVRDEVALPTREPCRSCRSVRPVDRQGAPPATAEGDRARHGFEREPDLWRARRQRLQPAFGLHLLSNGRGSHAGPSPPTPPAFSATRRPLTLISAQPPNAPAAMAKRPSSPDEAQKRNGPGTRPHSVRKRL